VGEASEGSLQGAAGCQIGWAGGFGEAGFDEVEDDEAKEGDLFIEAGDGAGAVVVGKAPGLEFAGVEAVFEGVGVSRLPAWATRGGDKRTPFER
jgi:hypothetical protein